MAREKMIRSTVIPGKRGDMSSLTDKKRHIAKKAKFSQPGVDIKPDLKSIRYSLSQ
jgi:hypothetical protein